MNDDRISMYLGKCMQRLNLFICTVSLNASRLVFGLLYFNCTFTHFLFLILTGFQPVLDVSEKRTLKGTTLSLS